MQPEVLFWNTSLASSDLNNRVFFTKFHVLKSLASCLNSPLASRESAANFIFWKMHHRFQTFFWKKRPLSRQGRPTGIRITGSASFRARGRGLLDHPYARRYPPSASPTGKRQGVRFQTLIVLYYLECSKLVSFFPPPFPSIRASVRCWSVLASWIRPSPSYTTVPAHSQQRKKVSQLQQRLSSSPSC